MSKSGYEFAKAVIAKNKAIVEAARNKDKKKVAKIVKTPARSYKKSSSRSSSKNSSKQSNDTGSSNQSNQSNQSDQPVQDVNNMPEGIPSPPPAPSIYGEGQPLEGEGPSNTGVDRSTQQALEDAPFSPIKTTSSGESNKKYYDTKKRSFSNTPTQKKSDVVMTQEQYSDMRAAKNTLEEVGQEQISWQPDPQAEFYTISDKDFNPVFLHGPGATKDSSSDLFPGIPGVQLTPRQTDIYMENMGKSNLKQAEDIVLGKNILDYTRNYATFNVDGKQKTFREIQKDDPALVLRTTENMDVKLDYDFTSWFKKQDTRTQSMGRFFGGFANWNYIIETVGHGDFDKGTDIVSEWTYGQSQRWKNNDVVGMITSTPMVQNIVLPAAGGAVLSGLVRGGSAVTGFVANKGFTNTAAALSYTGRGVLAGGTVAVGGLAIADVARSPSDMMLAKTLTYGTQFASFGIGARAVQQMTIPKVQREIVEISMPNQPTRMIGQKYVELFGKKVYSPFSTVAVGPRQAPINIRTGFGSGKTGFDVSPNLGYGNVGGKPSSIFDIRWDGSIQKSTWQGKTFFDTGGGWQPKTGLYMESEFPVALYQSMSPTLFKWPGKPVLYGSYNMPYQNWLDPQFFLLESGSFTTTEGMVRVKNKPILKDFSQDFRVTEQGFDMQPGVSQGQKQETVQLLKTEKVQKQKLKLELLQEQSVEQVSLQEYGLQSKMKTQNMFHPEYQVQAIGSAYDMRSASAVMPVWLQGSKSAYASLSGMMSGLDSAKVSRSAVLPVFGSASAFASDMSFDTVSMGVHDYDFDVVKPVSPKIDRVKMPVISFDGFVPNTRKIKNIDFFGALPEIPKGRSKKKRYKGSGVSLEKYYSFKEFKVPDLNKIMKKAMRL